MQAITQLKDWLDGFDQRIPIETLKKRLADESISATNLADYIHFSDQRYSRNLLAHGDQYYALVMCWKPGQASPIHDHKGASCGVRIIQGVATEVSYSLRDGKLIEGATTVMSPGEVCGSFDDDIHRISNLGEQNLVSLHVYSPFLDNINLYDMESGDVSVFFDPLVASLTHTAQP